jgi:hypothetical protein
LARSDRRISHQISLFEPFQRVKFKEEREEFQKTRAQPLTF